MSLYTIALERIFADAKVYVALLTGPPDSYGAHEQEVVAPWYTRQATDAWAVTSDMEGVYLTHTDPLVWSAVTGSDLTIHAWGIYLDEEPGGALVAAGLIKNINMKDQPRLLQVGDQARFLAGGIRIRSGI